MPLNTKLLSVKISFKNAKITLMLILGFHFFNFCLTASIPSLWGILVYKEQTLKGTLTQISKPPYMFLFI